MANIMVPFHRGCERGLGACTLQIDFFPRRHSRTFARSAAQAGCRTALQISPSSFRPIRPGRFPDNDIFELPLLIGYRRGRLIRSLAHVRRRPVARLSRALRSWACLPGSIRYMPSFPMDDLVGARGPQVRGSGYLQISDDRGPLARVPVGGGSQPRITENLDRGIIDATLLDWNSVSIYRIPEVAEHHLDAPWAPQSCWSP